MSEIIRFTEIFLDGLGSASSLVVEEGSITVILTAKEEVNSHLIRLILGFEQPSSGAVFVNGIDISGLNRKDIHDLRKNIGTIAASGGLVSNLKVWENLTLPLYYHTSLSQDEIETKGLAILKRVGYGGKLFDLTGHLSLFQKRMLGFARAMLSEPDLMVYESPMLGLNLQERNRLLQTALDFHKEKAGRTSLFLTSNQEAPAMLKNATVISLLKGQPAC